MLLFLTIDVTVYLFSEHRSAETRASSSLLLTHSNNLIND